MRIGSTVYPIEDSVAVFVHRIKQLLHLFEYSCCAGHVAWVAGVNAQQKNAQMARIDCRNLQIVAPWERIRFSENFRSPKAAWRGCTRALMYVVRLGSEWVRLVHMESLGFSKPKTRGILGKPKA